MVRILRSLTFRLALIYLGLFTISVIGLITLTWWVTVLEPGQQVRAAVRSEAEALAALQEGDDLRRLAERLAVRADTPAERPAFHVLQAPDGSVVAANLPRWPGPAPGTWQRFELEEFETEDLEEHEVLAYDLVLPDGARLLVGRDTEDLDDREEMIVDALSWGAGATLVIGLIGGLLMSLEVARRIEAVSRTARRVMAGDLSGRVAVRGTGDDFDRLAETLNAMLTRIETLVHSVSRVSDSVAHELRTPLTRLHADLDELAAALEQGQPEQRHLAEQALREVARLQATFDALLRIARIETGRHATSQESVDLAILLEDAADLYGPAAEDKGQTIDLRIAPALRTRGDPNLLFQAFSNLLDNAIKYGPDGSAIAVCGERADNRVVVTIRDRGPGIPEQHRAHVVERFYRVPGSEAIAGLGLGLSLVAAVAGLHRARLVLENAEPGLRAILSLRADDPAAP